MSWATARNLLCVRLDSMGDVLMTTPALRALKESVPGRRITLLTSRTGAAAARMLPEVDAILQFPAPWMKPPAGGPARDLALIRRLAQRSFDGAVIFTVYSQSALPAAYFCHLAGIPLRLAHCRENPYGLLTDWVPEREPQMLRRHEVRRQLDLVAAIDCSTRDERLSLSIPAAAMRSARREIRALDLCPGLPRIVVHPGASAASRRYPAESYVAALNFLQRCLECELLFTGDANEVALVERIRRDLVHPSHTLAGRLTLSELAAVIADAQLLISNNTGPVHVAAATGTPVVDLYALTNPQHTPWQVPSRVLFEDVPCRYCYKSTCIQGHHRCLRGVKPSRVAFAALELLGEALPTPARAQPPRSLRAAPLFGVPA